MNTYTDQETNSDSGAIFDLAMEDKDLLTFIQKPLEESEVYWNETFKLRSVRENNMNLWLPKHYQNTEVYDFQEENLYQNPRIFISVETICSVVNARIAQPSVSPGHDSPTSTQLAKDVQTGLYAHSDKFRTNDLFRICTRNLLLKRAGYLKLRFDPSVGKYGEIVPELVMPEDLIIDQDAKYGEVPRFIAQRIKNKTFEELISLFPDSEQKILELAGVQRRNKKGELVAYKSQLAKKQTIYEVWFRYYEDLEYKGGLMWVDDTFTTVLGKMRNPNWNYDDEGETEEGAVSNILDTPEPPFIPINYLNDGSSYVDVTSMVEQSESMQKIHNRRGFQIMENADQAGSGLVFNTIMITKSDIAKLTGSPDERIGVKGDVRAAVARVAPPPLPAYVIEDKLYSAQQIDDIFGTHDISRGRQSGNKTLGQDQIQVQQDYTRMDDISRAVERMAVKYYRYLAQMFKVYYTEEHWFKVAGEDGQFDFVRMKNDLVEDGIDITVDAGSTMPMNKEAQQVFATNLAKFGMIDPLTLYEVGSGAPMPSPKKMLERLMAYKTNPMQFAGMAASDEFDRNALMDIQVLNSGQLPIPRDDINEQYLSFFNKYMTTADYQKAIAGKPEVAGLYTQHLLECQRIAQATLALLETQLPSPQEQELANQKSAENAQQDRMIDGGGQPSTVQGNQPPTKGQAMNQPKPEKGAVPPQASVAQAAKLPQA